MAGLNVQPLNCALKASGESSTDAMIAVMAKAFEAKAPASPRRSASPRSTSSPA
jgi:hypothetical protein